MKLQLKIRPSINRRLGQASTEPGAKDVNPEPGAKDVNQLKALSDKDKGNNLNLCMSVIPTLFT
jgi:hypothetical protein